MGNYSIFNIFYIANVYMAHPASSSEQKNYLVLTKNNN